MSRRTALTLTALLVCSTLLVSGVWAILRVGPPDSGTTRSALGVAQSADENDRARALTVVRAWDEQRAKAYADGDLAALGKLYLSGSVSGRSDRRLLREYADRGLRVQDMRTQILDLEIRDQGENSMLLRVTDRLSGATAVGPGVKVRLPRDLANTRDVEFRRVGPDWVVAEADPITSDQEGAGGVEPSAEDRTSWTSLSRNS